jgi:hypothetical protein
VQFTKIAEAQIVDTGQIRQEMVLKSCIWWLSFNQYIFSCQENIKKYYYVGIIGGIFALTYLANM